MSLAIGKSVYAPYPGGVDAVHPCDGLASLKGRIVLDAAEGKAMDLKRKIIDGQERVDWNP